MLLNRKFDVRLEVCDKFGKAEVAAPPLFAELSLSPKILHFR